MEKNLDLLRIQQGVMGEKIACNVFVRQGVFSNFPVATYSPFDIVIKGDKKVQIKTLIPFVKQETWSIHGKSQVKHFLESDECYILSVPANVDSIPGKEHLWKYQGKMLKVNLKKLGQYLTAEDLTIPMSDEFVEEYDTLSDEACLSLLKYPVSYFAMKPETWKQHSHKRFNTPTPAK